MPLNRDDWNTFVLEQGPRSGRFLQSWEWGQFQKRAGEQIERRVVEHEGELEAVGLFLKRSIPLAGRYWYAPRGPVATVRLSLEQMNTLTQGSRAFAIRVESETVPEGARKTIELQPSHTSMLDLSKSEEALLEGMHQKTRYNIRLAGRKGVHVSLGEHGFDEVWPLFEETGSRGGFRLHARPYYEQMLASLSSETCRAFLATAFFEEHPIAATIMIDFGDTRTYLHGASERIHRKLMAPYLLHWELIKAAKAKGLKWYDWWGVAPEGAGEHHPWAGISRFKRGFGGEEVAYPGTYDVVMKPLHYKLYQTLRAIRRKM